ncbi:MAG: 16S rRNA (cytidine(1402)-2'-O)-methyltransferase [Flavobacteriales bacterium]|jgi:16S rRNA (cytidine1402-2'-O)-methyltransferase|nr:16S rRNA (cytidine(1402)-2'-O)-methyltransferase [Flavobacteriales bacterium]|tara:strand:- start:126 stop:824 length:699 start_codon:yes stop_codon:yes gene_type:complete
MGEIFIIPTPIGNLGDFTYRSKETLIQVDKIYAEDTRTSKKLLVKYDINTPLFSYHQHNEHKIVDTLINEVKDKNLSIALISDAGTPGISDPGFLLVNKAKENNINIYCLPGATSIIPAIVQSGFATDEFSFYGFLPHKKGRKNKLQNIINQTTTIILLESPHRLLKLLKELHDLISNNRMVSVSRELTKIHEENIRGTAEELLLHFSSKKVKGEIVVIIDKAPKQKKNVGI